MSKADFSPSTPVRASQSRPPIHPPPAIVVSMSSDILRLRLLASLMGAASGEENAARHQALRERYDEISERILMTVKVLTKGGDNVEG